MTRTTTIDIALPVLNEQRCLERNVRDLMAKLPPRADQAWSISIVDNGSTDASWEIAARIAQTERNVRALRLGQRGRGRALKAAWTSSAADIVAYMDIDLSTDLAALGPLVDAIVDGGADIAIGSRLMSDSQVTRSVRREVISHIYNLIARGMLRYAVYDAQCGFKAVTRQVAQAVVPTVEDNGWFFDTELLALAWRRGLRIAELPVRWVEDDDSRVRIVNTALDDLRGIWRLVRHPEDGPTSTRDESEDVLESVPAESLRSGTVPTSAPSPTHHGADPAVDDRS
jgi:glycosyltransferase involved in cell wall biosynthesis